MEIAITILQLLCALVLILSVMFQSGSKDGLGAIGGAAESFVAKSKVKNIDAKLHKLTIIAGIIFVIATVALNIISLSK